MWDSIDALGGVSPVGSDGHSHAFKPVEPIKEQQRSLPPAASKSYSVVSLLVLLLQTCIYTDQDASILRSAAWCLCFSNFTN
jgi:hypothetical protein